jgi:hypothetical protein
MATFPKDGRRGARVRHDSVLELLDDEGRPAAGALKLFDVSSVGASFSTTRKFAKGEKLCGRLRILGAGVLEFTGRIVRFKERENSTLYGVEFDSVTAPRR